MPPEDSQSQSGQATPTDEEEQQQHDDAMVQSLYMVRHGDRWDYDNPQWLKETSRPGDPPLSALGHQQARETGTFLDGVLSEQGIASDNITWLCSPFLRTIQTSDDMLNVFTKTKDSRSIGILPEYSVFEWDGKGGAWHASLPSLEERRHYFPRLMVSHQSLFTPSIPEPRSAFLSRCNRAMAALNSRYHYQPRTAIVIVTHAAACIGLTRAAAQVTLQDITPAAPCSVYRLTRCSDTPVWQIDAHDAPRPTSYNGYVGHLSRLGKATVPWNHFGGENSRQGGYTGPINSPLAPSVHS